MEFIFSEDCRSDPVSCKTLVRKTRVIGNLHFFWQLPHLRPHNSVYWHSLGHYDALLGGEGKQGYTAYMLNAPGVLRCLVTTIAGLLLLSRRYCL
jgi:hypothetical protein